MVCATLFALFQFINIRLFFKDTLFEINFASIFFYIHIILFLYIDFFAGSLTIFWNFAFFAIGKIIYIESIKKNYNNEYFYCLLILHILAWIGQILGHVFFEKRAPAMLDNLFLFSNAPFFITCEILKDFGWKKDEFIVIDEIIAKKIKVFKEKKMVKK